MTVLHVALSVPAADGSRAPARGVLRFSPSARRAVDGTAILPVPFPVTLTAGVADVTVEPSGPEWVWRIDERIDGARSRTIYARITGASVNYVDLVPLDPDSLAPAPGPDPAWAAPLSDLKARLVAGAVTPDPANPGFYLIGA